jgi:hypothetical protein
LIQLGGRRQQRPPKSYGLKPLRCDLRKVKGHDPLRRDGNRYGDRLTPKGVQATLVFLFERLFT